ncbi:hypothetical protein PInf_019918 [Phytophthora infestans]|nr:hypothetical protein PInf_019918 [Phytophthora infestans]
MNVWIIDGEPEASRHRVKKTCFADEVELVSTSGWGDDTKAQRRKQRSRVELLVEDSDDANEDVPGKGANPMTSVKVNEISTADVVEAVGNESRAAEPTQTSNSNQERQNRKELKRESPAKSNQEITVHHLVREFLLMHCHDDVVRILDQERPIPLLGGTEVKQLSRRLIGTDKTSANLSVPSSLLERFLVCSNEAKVKARAKRNAKVR